MAGIRRAELFDAPKIVELAERRRVQYQKYHPTFWRKAKDSRERHLPYVADLIESDRAIVLVHDHDSTVDGFIIGTLEAAPAVYDPGGPTCIVDDFMVAYPELWQTVGIELLGALIRQARKQGAVQALVVSGHLDKPKRTMLALQGYAIASEGYVKELVPRER